MHKSSGFAHRCHSCWFQHIFKGKNQFQLLIPRISFLCLLRLITSMELIINDHSSSQRNVSDAALSYVYWKEKIITRMRNSNITNRRLEFEETFPPVIGRTKIHLKKSRIKESCRKSPVLNILKGRNHFIKLVLKSLLSVQPVPVCDFVVLGLRLAWSSV